MTDTLNVPLLPTKEMLEAAISHALSVGISGDYTWYNYMQDLYVLMITSAPAQPSDDVVKDAARYRWLKEQKQLSLRSCGGRWAREDGSKFVSSHRLAAGDTLFGPQETLDAAIDAAMAGGGE